MVADAPVELDDACHQLSQQRHCNTGKQNGAIQPDVHATGWVVRKVSSLRNYVASSHGVEVYGNRLSGNYNGITGTQQNRTDSTPPAHLPDDYHVHDNLICAVGAGGHPTGVVADNGANLASRDISFGNNTTRSASG